MYKLKNILVGLLIVTVTLLLNACIVVRSGPGYRPPVQNTVVYRHWYYYPSDDVYYNVTEHYYYYLDGGTWRMVSILPEGWVLRNDDRVLLRISGAPYIKHTEHQRKYPARYNAGRHHDYPHDEREHRENMRNRPETAEHWKPEKERDYDDSRNRQYKPEHPGRDFADENSRGREQSRREMPPSRGRSEEVQENSPQRREYPQNGRQHDKTRDQDRRYEQHQNRGNDNRAHPPVDASEAHDNSPQRREYPQNGRHHDMTRDQERGYEQRQNRENKYKPTQPGMRERHNGGNQDTAEDNRANLPADAAGQAPMHGSAGQRENGNDKRRHGSRRDASGNYSQQPAAGAQGQKDTNRKQNKHSDGNGKQKSKSENDNAESGSDSTNGKNDEPKGNSRKARVWR